MISSESALVSLIELTPTTEPTNPLATAAQALSEMGPVTSEKAFSGILTSVLEPVSAPERALPELPFEEPYFEEEIAPETPPQLSEVFAPTEEEVSRAATPEVPSVQVEWSAAPRTPGQLDSHLQPEPAGIIAAPVFHPAEAFTPLLVSAEVVVNPSEVSETSIASPQPEVTHSEIGARAVSVPAESAPLPARGVEAEGGARPVPNQNEPRAVLAPPAKAVSREAAKLEVHASAERKSESPASKPKVPQSTVVRDEVEQPTEAVEKRTAEIVVPQMRATHVEVIPQMAAAMLAPAPIPAAPAPELPRIISTGQGNEYPEPMRTGGFSPSPMFQAEVARRYQTVTTPTAPAATTASTAPLSSVPVEPPAKSPMPDLARVQAAMAGLTPVVPVEYAGQLPATPAAAPEFAAASTVQESPKVALQVEVLAPPIEPERVVVAPSAKIAQPAVQPSAPAKMASANVLSGIPLTAVATPAPASAPQVTPDSPSELPISPSEPTHQAPHSTAVSIDSQPVFPVETPAVRIAPSIREGTQEINLPQPRKAESLFSNGEPVKGLKPLTQRPLETTALTVPPVPRNVPQAAVVSESHPAQITLPKEPVKLALSMPVPAPIIQQPAETRSQESRPEAFVPQAQVKIANPAVPTEAEQGTLIPATTIAPAPIVAQPAVIASAAPILQAAKVSPQAVIPAAVPSAPVTATGALQRESIVAPVTQQNQPQVEAARPAISTSHSATPARPMELTKKVEVQTAAAPIAAFPQPSVVSQTIASAEIIESKSAEQPVFAVPAQVAASPMKSVEVVATPATRSPVEAPTPLAESVPAAVEATPLPIQKPGEPATVAQPVESRVSTPHEQPAASDVPNAKPPQVVAAHSETPRVPKSFSASPAAPVAVPARVNEPEPPAQPEMVQTPMSPSMARLEEPLKSVPQKQIVAASAIQPVLSSVAPVPQSTNAAVEAVNAQPKVLIAAPPQERPAQAAVVPVPANIQNVVPKAERTAEVSVEKPSLSQPIAELVANDLTPEIASEPEPAIQTKQAESPIAEAASKIRADHFVAPTPQTVKMPQRATAPQTQPEPTVVEVTAEPMVQIPVEAKPEARSTPPIENSLPEPAAFTPPSSPVVEAVKASTSIQNATTSVEVIPEAIAAGPVAVAEWPISPTYETPVIPAPTRGEAVSAPTAATLSPALAVSPGTEPVTPTEAPVLVAPVESLSTVAQPAPGELVVSKPVATVARTEVPVAASTEVKTEAHPIAPLPTVVEMSKPTEVHDTKIEPAPSMEKVQTELSQQVGDKLPVAPTAARQSETIAQPVVKSPETAVPVAKTQPIVASPTVRPAVSQVAEMEPGKRQTVSTPAPVSVPVAKVQPIEAPAQPTGSTETPMNARRAPVARPGVNRPVTGRTISGLVRTSTDLRFVNPTAVPMTAKSPVSTEAAPKISETRTAPATPVARVQAPIAPKVTNQVAGIAKRDAELPVEEIAVAAAELEVSAVKYPVATKNGALVEIKAVVPKLEAAVVADVSTKPEANVSPVQETAKPVEVEAPKVAARANVTAQSNVSASASASTPPFETVIQPALAHAQRQSEVSVETKSVETQPKPEPAAGSGAAMSNNGSETGFQRGGEGRTEAREQSAQKAGMPAAKLVSSVRNDQNRNNSAEPSVLERAETPRRGETTAPAESLAGPHGLEWIANLSSIPSIKAPEAGTHAESASPLRNAPPVIDWLARNIESEVRAVRQFNAEHLSVVVRPDAQTELVIDLKNHNGRVEATARCERGDSAALAAGWSTLQAHLAQRGVDLAALPSGGTGSSNNAFSSNTQTQTGRDGQSGRRMPQEEKPDSPSAFGSNPGRRNLEKPRTKLPGLNRAQEWWA